VNQETTVEERATANTGTKGGPKKATATKASKPTRVTKKKAPAKKTCVALTTALRIFLAPVQFYVCPNATKTLSKLHPVYNISTVLQRELSLCIPDIVSTSTSNA
jgi:hypothetical protein